MSTIQNDATASQTTETPKVLNEYEVLKGRAIQLKIENPHKIKKETLRQLVADAEAKATEMPNGEIKIAPGRPVNPNSKRQQRIADLEARRAQPDFKLGRPVQTESQRQQKLAERQAKIDAYNAQQLLIANGEVIAPEALLPNPSDKLGRPVNPDSPRQIKLREYEAKKAAGQIKKGRPSFESKGLPPSKSSKQTVVSHTVPAPTTNVVVNENVPAE